MSRLDIKSPSRAQTVVDNLYRDVERRIAASPPGLCPVDMSLSFLQLCHAQSCGKCVPCRIGLGQLSKLIATVLDGTADMGTLAIIEKTARTVVNTADCAIGRDAARLVLDGLEGFRDDYEEHILHHRCLAGLQLPVPCVALCPAGVDVPGYMALIGEGRCADAVRLIRKDNPFPVACAYICELAVGWSAMTSIRISLEQIVGELSTRSAACGSNPLGEMTRWLPYGSPRMVESPFCSEILYF